MRDSIGGVVNIMFIGVFLLVVSAYLALSVSYNKAFRVKNKIIKILEQHDGLTDSAKQEISEQMRQIGYNQDDSFMMKCGKDVNGAKTYNYHCENGYCVAWVPQGGDVVAGYYRVATSIVINIPILNRISGISTFTVSGDTITIYPDSNADLDVKPNCS